MLIDSFTHTFYHPRTVHSIEGIMDAIVMILKYGSGS